MIIPDTHPFYPQALLIHMVWDLLPVALDAALAGEIDPAEVPDYVRYMLAVEAGHDGMIFGQHQQPYIPNDDGLPLVRWLTSHGFDDPSLPVQYGPAAIRNQPQ